MKAVLPSALLVSVKVVVCILKKRASYFILCSYYSSR